MTEISELQKKRADNIIWNSAGDYSFTPDFKSYDPDGNAELYWNIIIGAVRRHYDYPKIEELLHGVQQYEESGLYEGILWLALENAVIAKEVIFRPVLRSLRSSYAQDYLRDSPSASQPVSGFDSARMLENITLAYWRRAATRSASGKGDRSVSHPSGKDHGAEKKDEDPYLRTLLDDLDMTAGFSDSLTDGETAFCPLTTDELVEKLRKLLQKWFRIVADAKRNGSRRKLPGIRKEILRVRKKKSTEKYIRFGRGIAFHPDNVYGGESIGTEEKNELSTKLSASELRQFMEAKFGRSLCSPVRTAELEKTICKGNHDSCHILFTDGVRLTDVSIRNGFEALARQREAAQLERNRNYYTENRARNSLAISRLSANIRNSILLHLQPSPVRSDSGGLDPVRAWRAPVLDDNRVFLRQENDNMGDLCVDLLLDASTSQRSRQEIISSQGYILAESLSKCGIPCRVMSFCSMTGYTVVRVFRDYNHPADNVKIFEYVSNGCNRDGLAIRTASHFIAESPYEHKMLIVLSDVKPNDVVKIYKNGESEGISYDTAVGLEDTALEVRRARADGISVLCIFTGEDEDLPSAKLVYGRDFVRIRSFDMLADTVGMLIRNQIRNL